MKISFLIFDVHGIGGTIRSTVNLAGALAARHEVEIVSLLRTADAPALAVDPRVTVRSLVEARKGAPGFDPAHDPEANPARVFPQGDGPYKRASALVDERAAEWLSATDADVLIGTRPGINVYLAEYAPASTLRIGQEHLTHAAHRAPVREAQDAVVPRLDAFVTVSEADALDYRDSLALPADRDGASLPYIRCIPNACPPPRALPSDGSSRTIVAAGRLAKVKNYGMLLDAFAEVAAVRPDWSLRLYGRGREEPGLRRRIEELGLADRATLMGAHSPIETEWSKGAIAAVTSHSEAFGLTIVEAMHAGLPVVATDCPYGPGEIIEDGRDGVLTPPGDPHAFAEALISLIDDAERRRAMGEAARAKAPDYDPERIARRYEELIGELAAARGLPLGARAVSTPRAGSRRPGGLRSRTAAALRPLLLAVAPDNPAARKYARLRPSAFCRATEDGGLRVELPVDGVPGRRLDLVLRRRKGTGPEDEIRLPLPPRREAVDGRLAVTLARDAHRLAEGRWDFYVERPADGARRRVRAELVEQAPLMGLPPRADEAGVSAWIPYATSDGRLAVRAWLRPAHAEVHGVRVGTYGTTVEGELLGATFAGGDSGGEGRLPEVELRRRADEDVPTASLRLPVDRAPGGDQALGTGFSFTLPHDDFAEHLAGERELWDLWLLTGNPEDAPVRVGRLGGDIVDRKRTDVFPAAERELDGAERARVRPYFTTVNNLAIAVRPESPDQAPAIPLRPASPRDTPAPPAEAA
ncbi:glycosyltransferase family 4 protein [Streptomyces sp. ODS28]|uniref:glycosyltransferase family 4 protein n=1 Tax=Streptomyces sp. ODS28 TaxID=3136688 RepID=UPI0031F00567